MMGRVSKTFPAAPKGQRGYDVSEVETFLAEARAAYTGGADSSIDSAHIRRTAFAMKKGGYSTAHVDQALERLEDAFASRERERSVGEAGDEGWFSEARTTAEQIVARLDRQPGQRFDRVSVLTVGYHPKDVDRLARRLQGYFTDGKALSIDEVRGSVFRAKRGGYRESQVDLVLDAVVDVMLAVR